MDPETPISTAPAATADSQGFARLYKEARASSNLGDRARESLRYLALSGLGLLRRPASEPWLRGLYGHYVFDDYVREFREQLERLRRVGRFITGAQVVEIVAKRRPLDGHYFHLSFDDGFDNLYRNAFPVLRELEVPATLFVPSGFIDLPDRQVAEKWWDRNVFPKPTRPLTWAWLREMADAGIEIGAHTRNHVRLSTVANDPGRLRDEVRGSKMDIEDRLGRSCPVMSWPYGRMTDVDDRVLDAVREAGYSACFSAVRGRVIPGQTSIWTIPRHHFEPHFPWLHVKYFACGGHEGPG